MISRLVESAFQTGYLSVESEGLIRQMLTAKVYRPADLQALSSLYTAIDLGKVRREAKQSLQMPTLR
jgi:hypothetical protein